jgi:uncharacterized alkaline shock family protein YloU
MAETKNGISNPAPNYRGIARSSQNSAPNGQTAVLGSRKQANGTVRFAEEVIAAIAFLAAAEVKGVAAKVNKSDITEDRMIKKNMLRGIKIRFNENNTQIDIPITVKAGFRAVSVARSVQCSVGSNVENMTGLAVSGVNVTVAAIQYKSENE